MDDKGDGGIDDPAISDSQVSQLAKSLRNKPDEAAQAAENAPKRKTFEDLSVLSLLTMPGKKWSKKKTGTEEPFHIQGRPLRSRPLSQNPASDSSAWFAKFLLFLLIVGVGFASYHFYFSTPADSASDSRATESESTLNELLEKK